MKNIFSLLSILSCTLGYCAVLCFPALADQCSYITKEQASTAISRLNLNQTIFDPPIAGREGFPYRLTTMPKHPPERHHWAV